MVKKSIDFSRFSFNNIKISIVMNKSSNRFYIILLTILFVMTPLIFVYQVDSFIQLEYVSAVGLGIGIPILVIAWFQSNTLYGVKRILFSISAGILSMIAVIAIIVVSINFYILKVADKSIIYTNKCLTIKSILTPSGKKSNWKRTVDVEHNGIVISLLIPSGPIDEKKIGDCMMTDIGKAGPFYYIEKIY